MGSGLTNGWPHLSEIKEKLVHEDGVMGLFLSWQVGLRKHTAFLGGSKTFLYLLCAGSLCSFQSAGAELSLLGWGNFCLCPWPCRQLLSFLIYGKLLFFFRFFSLGSPCFKAVLLLSVIPAWRNRMGL